LTSDGADEGVTAMTPSSERPAAPEIDSAALATTIAAYQRSRRLLDALRAGRSTCETPPNVVCADDPRGDVSRELIHETRINRARLRDVVAGVVVEAVCASVPKATLVRRVNDHVNGLVRRRAIEPEGPILAEIIEWIVDGYPSDLMLESGIRATRPTPPHSRDVIPLHLLRQERAS
jgi:hypothetical protein